ncbi:hypothetical protein GCM10009789_48540 [Kribbella sancticallisti]|uniref:Uncharacterized protein n=1 Tax=Kribbella sancticallisti TaxID=460087 RepID=A0ABP4PX80_9ACTN
MLRQFDVPTDMVVARDVSVLVRLLGGEQLSGPQARQLQGSIFLAFPGLERDDAHLLADDRIVAYLASAHDAVPHLFYFLAPLPAAGALLGFLAGASGTPGVTADGSAVVDEQALEKLAWHLTKAAEYAESVGDDWHRMADSFISQLPDEHASLLNETLTQHLVD